MNMSLGTIDTHFTPADKLVLADLAENKQKQEAVPTHHSSAHRPNPNEYGHVNGTNIGKKPNPRVAE